MDEEEKGLYTVAEAAEAWGISTNTLAEVETRKKEGA